LQIFSILNSDDASAPALETQPQGDEEGEHQQELHSAVLNWAVWAVHHNVKCCRKS